MSAIDDLTDKNNWLWREDYSHGNQTIIYEYVGGLHPPVQHARAEYEALLADNARMKRVIEAAMKWAGMGINSPNGHIAMIELVSALEEYELSL